MNPARCRSAGAVPKCRHAAEMSAADPAAAFGPGESRGIQLLPKKGNRRDGQGTNNLACFLQFSITLERRSEGEEVAMKRKRLSAVAKMHDPHVKDEPSGRERSIKDQQSLDFWIALARLH